MSEYIVTCTSCASPNLTIIKEKNPHTIDLNMDVVYRCEDCQVEFDGQATSHHTDWQYEQGFII